MLYEVCANVCTWALAPPPNLGTCVHLVSFALLSVPCSKTGVHCDRCSCGMVSVCVPRVKLRSLCQSVLLPFQPVKVWLCFCSLFSHGQSVFFFFFFFSLVTLQKGGFWLFQSLVLLKGSCVLSADTENVLGKSSSACRDLAACCVSLFLSLLLLTFPIQMECCFQFVGLQRSWLLLVGLCVRCESASVTSVGEALSREIASFFAFYDLDC